MKSELSITELLSHAVIPFLMPPQDLIVSTAASQVLGIPG
jgi:hypothetical protein